MNKNRKKNEPILQLNDENLMDYLFDVLPMFESTIHEIANGDGHLIDAYIELCFRQFKRNQAYYVYGRVYGKVKRETPDIRFGPEFHKWLKKHKDDAIMIKNEYLSLTESFKPVWERMNEFEKTEFIVKNLLN